MSTFGDELMEAMQEVFGHVKGQETGMKLHSVNPQNRDPRAIRKGLGVTQEQMALMLGVSLSGYRKWEQGQREPSGAAKMLLRVMDKEPQAVLRALKLG